MNPCARTAAAATSSASATGGSHSTVLSQPSRIRVVTYRQGPDPTRQRIADIKEFLHAANVNLLAAQVVTPYASVARFRNSQHLDGDPRIGKLISENRHDFENFVQQQSDKAAKLGVEDCPEITRAVELIEQAKDVFGRALIHSIGKVKGENFHRAIQVSVLKGRAYADGLAESQRQWDQMSEAEKAKVNEKLEADVLNE
jgi:hypothetical protein